jgi:hypothetical protein
VAPASPHEPARPRALAFFSTVTTFGAAIEITTSELAIESFYPADAHTGKVVRAIG